MELNYYAILTCAIASMVIGGIWYGPLFGRKWMEIIGVDPNDKNAHKDMAKGTGILYLVGFVLALFQAYVLAHFIAAWRDGSGVETSLWIWAGFIIPALAGASMWTIESTKNKWSKFLIQTGYQLVLFVVFGLILSYWV